MRKRKRWLLVIVMVSVIGLGYLAFTLVTHAGADYFTVSELMSQADSLHGQQLRVEGRVAPGSIDWDDKSKVMKFVLADDKESLNMIYKGIVPDNFKPGAGLVVEGEYLSDSTFEALSFGDSRSFCSFCH